MDFVEDVIDFTLQGGSMEVFMYLQQITDDTVIETPSSEDFFLRITASHPLIDEGRLTIAPDSAVVTIIDNGINTYNSENCMHISMSCIFF